jgi:hypothetical protein
LRIDCDSFRGRLAAICRRSQTSNHPKKEPDMKIRTKIRAGRACGPPPIDIIIVT